ncbi:phosphoribosyltransferase [Paraglaciecola hydrolytica]|uniref:Hypoxanthine phosphoribosyltransferase n=1 Tax=Paraglaciecola hydrolytica TaxID=1799789 RepID=A0A136A6B7_9ALTE|nr:phosphoribosyltransferase family protein [Paraglaciecola hydrolytica]KXI30778.1 hypoxanthine phosphoribosyltransferase [Paraglaciecola hydrolytica]
MEKTFITAQQLLEDSFRLASQVYEDGFRPTFIIGIWRGGAPIGIAVQEYFDFKKVVTDHIAVRTSSYYGIDQQSKTIKVHGLHYLIENANKEDTLLIVDDVFDSGRSVDALVKQIKKLSRANMPHDVRIATPYFKPKNNKTELTPNYFVHISDEWLVFPHEIDGLTPDEIINGKKDLVNVMHLLKQ